MFEFDAAKLLIIGIVALIVIGPKELPRVMRQFGQAVAKLRRLGTEFQSQFMEAMREADAEEMRSDMRKLAESAKFDLGVNPLALATAELTAALQRPVDKGVISGAIDSARPDETSGSVEGPEAKVTPAAADSHP